MRILLLIICPFKERDSFGKDEKITFFIFLIYFSIIYKAQSFSQMI